MIKSNSLNFKDQVYKLVKQIPQGKVMTYRDIALALGRLNWSRQVGWPRTELSSRRGLRPRPRGAFMQGKAFLARAVGNALHKNSDPSVPCHRVVDRNGRLAPNFGFGGAKEQRKYLLAEKIKFRDKMHVDLSKSLWK